MIYNNFFKKRSLLYAFFGIIVLGIVLFLISMGYEVVNVKYDNPFVPAILIGLLISAFALFGQSNGYIDMYYYFKNNGGGL